MRFARLKRIAADRKTDGVQARQRRLENLVPPEAMPFDNITGKHFDSGDYPECLRRASLVLCSSGGAGSR